MSSLIKTNKTFVFCNNPSRFLKHDVMISAGRLGMGVREFVWSLCHKAKRNKKDEKVMQAGKDAHEEIQQGIKTLNEYGYTKFRRDLYKHNKIKLAEVDIISPTNGIYGIIDLLTIEYTQDKDLNIWVDEIKPIYCKRYFMQMMAYVLSMNDVHTKVIVGEAYSRKDGIKREPYPLFPAPNDIRHINIFARVYTYKSKLKGYYECVINNQWFGGFSEVKLGALKRLHKYQDIMRDKVFDISKVPHDKPAYCCKYGYAHLCKKIPYEPNTHQTYYGRSRLLIKTKPRLI